MSEAYIKHQISNIINIHKIAIVNFFEFKEEFSSIGEKHNFWEFVYVDKGVLRVNRTNESFNVSSGECVFHKPNEYHHHKPDSVEGASYYVIGFICNSAHMQSFREKHFKLSPKLTRYIVSILEEASCVFDFPFNNPSNQKLKISEHALLGGQQMIRTYLEQFLILLLRQNYNISNSPSPANETNEGQLVTQIKNKLSMSLYQKVNIDELCREMNYSRSYLSKIFLKECGCTMGEYARKLKIEEAKMLIGLNSYNFTQISDMLGFSNPLYFSRVFKKITSVSPSEYKAEKKN